MRRISISSVLFDRTKAYAIVLFTIVALGLPCAALAGGRLLLSGPNLVNGELFTEIHEFNLSTGERTTFADFPHRPLAMAECPDGLLYVGLDPADGGIQKLDPLTGESHGFISIPNSAPVALLCLPDGTLLLVNENPGQSANSTIKHYDANGNDLGDWATGFYVARSLRLTPDGTVAFFCCGHPAYEANALVEYDLQGNFLREVIPTTAGLHMDSFVFTSAMEFLVNDRASECIKRHGWTDSSQSDFVCNPAKLGVNVLARHPENGAIYASDYESLCIWAWDADGNELYVNPLYDGAVSCYGPGQYLYVGDPLLVFADDGDQCGESDQGTTIVIDGCDTGVTNQVLADGSTMAGLICLCAADADNHGGFVSCVAHLTTDWSEAGLISSNERRKIRNCAAQAEIP